MRGADHTFTKLSSQLHLIDLCPHAAGVRVLVRSRDVRPLIWKVAVALGVSTLAAVGPAGAHDPEAEEHVERIVIESRRSITATSAATIPAEVFELYPLESGGQMLEAVPNLVTAQHTGGGKAEQYFIRGFDADHGTDLLVYFDGVPINLRSHAHGQGYLDLHFVTKEIVDRLDASKGPYFARYGDFATAAAIEYVPVDTLTESFAKFEGGSFDTWRAVGALTTGGGALEQSGPAQGYLSFEAYHTNGPFVNPENLRRYTGFARGHVDVTPDLVLSGHLVGYYGSWNASGLIPQALVSAGALDRFGSLDPTEGGRTVRVQGKAQMDWAATDNGRLMLNAYVAWYQLDLFSNFTYFLENDNVFGDGIVQRDDRVYTGGRLEYRHGLPNLLDALVRGGVEWRHDAADVLLGTQTRRLPTGCLRATATNPAAPCTDDRLQLTSAEPYVDLELLPRDWVVIHAGLRMAWLRFAGHDEVTGLARPSLTETRWLPKASVVLSPFSALGPLPSDIPAIRELELFVNFGIGYHSNDARAVFGTPGANTVPRATGAEVGLRTEPADWIELAIDWWWLSLEEEFVFVGDEGTTEASGRSERQGIELVATIWPLEWLYVRGDVAYTSSRLVDVDRPVPQAPRVIARAATGVRWEGFAAELSLRHLGDRYASEDFFQPRLTSYTVLDLAGRYRWRFLEVGLAIENLTNNEWSSSEFFYESQPRLGGTMREDFHFSPGNSINARAWVTAYF